MPGDPREAPLPGDRRLWHGALAQQIGALWAEKLSGWFQGDLVSGLEVQGMGGNRIRDFFMLS